jgi:hypothetical protein
MPEAASNHTNWSRTAFTPGMFSAATTSTEEINVPWNEPTNSSADTMRASFKGVADAELEQFIGASFGPLSHGRSNNLIRRR